MMNGFKALRPLGDTGIHVSPIGLGTVKFGRNQGVKYPNSFDIPDMDHLAGLLDLAKQLGINTLDTAPAYGLSEERLGALLQGQRQDWVIVGKVGEEFENGGSHYKFTPDHFKYSLDRSLSRLNCDYIDVLLIHSDGNDTQILQNDPLIRVMHDFKDQGLVKAIGASTKTAEGGIKALELMDCTMAMYTPNYTEEKAVLDYAAQHGKGVLLKKILESGHTNKISGADPIYESLKHGFAHKGVSAAVIGTITPENLQHNVKACLRALADLEAQSAAVQS